MQSPIQAVKERPILFSGAMVRAVLEGRKTQTRRVCKDQAMVSAAVRHDWLKCPYGQLGDRLWVRETFITGNPLDGNECFARDDNGDMLPEKTWYRADGDLDEWLGDDGCVTDRIPWKPSIHMPRSASRIMLEIISVRVERVRDIMKCETDAIAEGIFFTDYGRQCFHQHRPGPFPMDALGCDGPDETHPKRNGWMWAKTTSHEQCLGAAWAAFGNLWEKIHGAESWVENPWVWVVEFKRVEPA